MTRFLLASLFVFTFYSCDKEQKASSNNFVKIQELYKDGNYLGTIIGNDIGDKMYSQMCIIKKVGSSEDTLYRMNKIGLYNLNGLDEEVAGEIYDGYKIESMHSDTIRFFLYKKGGLSSDGIAISWNAEKKIFEVLRESPY
jgi:hypothetical protein